MKGEDTLVKRPITIPFDMVVHAIGMDPNVDNMTLSAVFDVKLEKHGHIPRRRAYSSMSATSRPGIFVAGAATGPETIDDSIAQGQSAAMAALTLARSAIARGGRIMCDDRRTVGLKRRGLRRRGRCSILSGPRLRASIRESGRSRPRRTGGIERYVGALALKASLFEEVLGKGRVSELTEAEFCDLAAFVTPVRRRIGAWLGRNSFAAMRRRLEALLLGWSDVRTTDARLGTFVASFPADREHRWSRDLAAEVLHFTLPDRYPLMTRWIWDARINTGVLREIWHGDGLNAGAIAVGDSFGTFATLREELEGFLQRQRRRSAICRFTSISCVRMFMPTTSTTKVDNTCTRIFAAAPRMIRWRTRVVCSGSTLSIARSGRTRLKLVDGEVHVLGEPRRLNS